MMDELINSLTDVNPAFDETRHMSCIAHVINLAVQDGLAGMDIPGAWDDECTVAIFEDEDGIFMVNTTSTNLRELVFRVRQIINGVRGSAQRREKYRLCCNAEGYNDSLPILDVPTRWNSTHDMLIDAYRKRLVLDKMAQLFMSKGARNFCLNDAEWEVVQHLASLLKPFREATQFLVQTKFVTASKVLKLMTDLQSRLRKLIRSLKEKKIFPLGLLLNDSQRLAVMNACLEMSNKLDKYAEKMKCNSAFTVAALVDPHVKLEPIAEADRKDVKIVVRKMLGDVIENQKPKPSARDRKGKLPYYYSEDSVIDIIEEMEAPPPAPPTSVEEELNKYLAMPPINEPPLNWWKRDGRHFYPRIAALAKEFLPICATSAPVERFLSSGRGICTFKRLRLKDNTIGMLMTLKCWFRKEYPELFDIIGDNGKLEAEETSSTVEGW